MTGQYKVNIYFNSSWLQRSGASGGSSAQIRRGRDAITTATTTPSSMLGSTRGERVRVYRHAMFITDMDPYDAVFSDIISGDVELGEKVKVWDSEECRYVIGVAELYGGQPSVRHLCSNCFRKERV